MVMPRFQKIMIKKRTRNRKALRKDEKSIKLEEDSAVNSTADGDKTYTAVNEENSDVVSEVAVVY